MKYSEIADYKQYGICVGANDYAGALKALEKCLAMPEIKINLVQHADLMQRKGIIYFRLGDVKRAIECFDKSESIDPTSLLVPYLYAKFLLNQLGDFATAIDKCDEIIARALAHPFPETDDDLSSEWYVKKASELKDICQRGMLE